MNIICENDNLKVECFCSCIFSSPEPKVDPASVRPSGFTNEHILVTLHVLWTNVGYICAIGYPILGMLNYLSEIAFMTHWLQCQISFSYPK